MKALKLESSFLAMMLVAALAGCSSTTTKSPEVSDSIHKALDQAGFKDVSTSQDRDKGVVTLGGHVATDGEKTQAQSSPSRWRVDKWWPTRLPLSRPDQHDAKAANAIWIRASSRILTPR
jgi:hypothetical protein